MWLYSDIPNVGAQKISMKILMSHRTDGHDTEKISKLKKNPQSVNIAISLHLMEYVTLL